MKTNYLDLERRHQKLLVTELLTKPLKIHNICSLKPFKTLAQEEKNIGQMTVSRVELQYLATICNRINALIFPAMPQMHC